MSERTTPAQGGFGERLRNLREAAGLTQTELAAKALVPQTTVSRIEADSDMMGGRAKRTALRKIAPVLGLSAGDLWAGYDFDAETAKREPTGHGRSDVLLAAEIVREFQGEPAALDLLAKYLNRGGQ